MKQTVSSTASSKASTGPSNVTCFKCGTQGHKSFECKNTKVMITMENGDIETFGPPHHVRQRRHVTQRNTSPSTEEVDDTMEARGLKAEVRFVLVKNTKNNSWSISWFLVNSQAVHRSPASNHLRAATTRLSRRHPRAPRALLPAGRAPHARPEPKPAACAPRAHPALRRPRSHPPNTRTCSLRLQQLGPRLHASQPAAACPMRGLPLLLLPWARTRARKNQAGHHLKSRAR
ncbi:hypothetical protein QYE76_027083 [Lolium multiflorum]|uniref:CCHC-type domain-containing protein n=1 Tax=Lolium multiflorum TaxID=4521 RepID=A0AAD8QIU9_LOLMU|nr:hypothetical protein QYE76_027083 [Lolium multiflorum]